jgi:ATP-binding cassette subfamily A (ABC1) protein 5
VIQEKVNEDLIGAPTIRVHKLKKTFPPSFHSAPQVAVNHLSFEMYNNQIFALLGHNGAGKVNAVCDMNRLTYSIGS